MSKHRKWTVGHSMGYGGTDSEEVLDLIDDCDWTEEQVAEATDEEIQKELSQCEWECACENINVFVRPMEED